MPSGCGLSPRVRGNPGGIARGTSRPGLSPRVRGNPQVPGRADWPQGSIPARAGEPERPGAARPAPGVYPRACGGTGKAGRSTSSTRGLSPRVRGNRPAGRSGPWGTRSIPARAGEPHWQESLNAARTVYPRACGGTRQLVNPYASRIGLSPRVRGNRLLSRDGEYLGAVYPRACGGTDQRIAVEIQGGGLSPRVRGNHPCLTLEYKRLRSIPARAGEPACATVAAPIP